MSSPNRKRFKLAEMRAQAMDTLGMEPGIDLELDNGEALTIPNPLYAKDEVQEFVNAGKTVDAAKLLLGAKEHARLLKHGGTSNDVMLAWAVMRDELNLDTKSG